MVRVGVGYIINIIQSIVIFFYLVVLVCQIIDAICCIALKVSIWPVQWNICVHIKIEAGRFNSISNKTRR